MMSTGISQPREGVAESLPDEVSIPMPLSFPSPYLQPPSLEDDESMFRTPNMRRHRPRVSNAKHESRVRRGGSRTNRRIRHSLIAKIRSLPAGDGPRRDVEPSPVLGSVYEVSAMDRDVFPHSDVATPRDVIPSYNERNGNMLPPLELDTHLIALPSDEACMNYLYMMRQSSEPYSFLDFPSHNVDSPSSQGQLPSATRGGLWGCNGVSTNVPRIYDHIEQQNLAVGLQDPMYLAPTSPLASYYDEATPFQTMSSNGTYSLQNDMLGGSSSMPAGQRYLRSIPSRRGAHVGQVRDGITSCPSSVAVQDSALGVMAHNSSPYDWHQDGESSNVSYLNLHSYYS
jgi:hypothetical protein